MQPEVYPGNWHRLTRLCSLSREVPCLLRRLRMTLSGACRTISLSGASCKETRATVNRPALGRIKGNGRLLPTLCALY